VAIVMCCSSQQQHSVKVCVYHRVESRLLEDTRLKVGVSVCPRSVSVTKAVNATCVVSVILAVGAAGSACAEAHRRCNSRPRAISAQVRANPAWTAESMR
jgi:hypothetical protein